MENGISNVDKLLICLAIILFLTIVWTILIGIMYRMGERKTTKVKKSKLLLDEDDDDDVLAITTTSSRTYKAKRRTNTKKTKKTKRTKKSNRSSSRRTTNVIKANGNKETYVKVKFYRTKRDLIYVAPENVILKKGDKVKVRTDEGDIRTATVTKGNYLREKYQTYEYQTLDLVN